MVSNEVEDHLWLHFVYFLNHVCIYEEIHHKISSYRHSIICTIKYLFYVGKMLIIYASFVFIDYRGEGSSRRKLDPSQKSATWKWTLQKNRRSWKGTFIKIGDLKMDPKIKNYNVMIYTCSAADEFTRKLLKNFTKLNFFAENKLFHKSKNIFHKNKELFFKIISKIHKTWNLKKKKKNWMDSCKLNLSAKISCLIVSYIPRYLGRLFSQI